MVTAVYLTWRTTSTVDLSVWWLAIPLLLAELHSAFGLTLYTLALWDVDVGPDWRPATRTGHRIAVLLPTYEEPEEVLLPSVVAAIALEPAHETWVLDDGDRPWVRALANELGARYLARAEHDHAKAGNLNHALQMIDADVIAVFDADHVVQPNFLRHTLAYFDDAAIAVVQTPQDFYNLESFEHEGTTHSDERPYHEEANFHRVIGPAMNHWGGAFWCGTGALIRVAALRDVGLVATGTVTEDIHTTIRMNRRGWRAVYHNEVLARGLAPSDASQYMLQRHRWALGAMQVQRAERPLTQRGLTFGQRLAFATTLFGWLDSSRTLAFMVLPIAVVISGSSPIDAPGEIYGPAFAATFVMQFAALRLLARGYSPPAAVAALRGTADASGAARHAGGDQRRQGRPVRRHPQRRRRGARRDPDPMAAAGHARRLRGRADLVLRHHRRAHAEHLPRAAGGFRGGRFPLDEHHAALDGHEPDSRPAVQERSPSVRAVRRQVVRRHQRRPVRDRGSVDDRREGGDHRWHPLRPPSRRISASTCPTDGHCASPAPCDGGWSERTDSRSVSPSPTGSAPRWARSRSRCCSNATGRTRRLEHRFGPPPRGGEPSSEASATAQPLYDQPVSVEVSGSPLP